MTTSKPGDEPSDQDHPETREALNRDLEGANIAIRAGLDATITALQIAHPDIAPLIAMWGAPAAEALKHLINMVAGRRERRAVYALGTGVRHAGVTIEDFVHRCEQDPELLQLCTKVITAAEDAVFQGKIDALARSLASALEDGAKVNEEILFTSVLEQLETPHIRLLAHIERSPAGTALASDQEPSAHEDYSYNRHQLAQLDPGLEDVLDPLLGTLSGYGLIVRRSAAGLSIGSGGPEVASYSLSDFGQHMLNRIRQGGQESSDSDSF